MHIKKRYLFLIIIISLFLLNLGRLLDVTVPPRKSDIIVYLGGGLNEPAEKSLLLYQKGYSKSGKIIYTGPKRFFYTQYFGKLNRSVDKKSFFLEHGLRPEQLIYNNASNTMKEIKFVKHYLIKHGLQSALFVTDPTHSRRVMLLSKLAGYKRSGIRITIVGSGVKWWDPSFYYLSKEGLAYSLLEVIKIPHNILFYGLLQRFGLAEAAKEHFGSLYQHIKSDFLSLFARIWK